MPTSPYVGLVAARLRAQASYRTSFAFDVISQLVVGFVQFAEVSVIFTRVDAVGGFSYSEVALLFGLAAVGFTVGDIVVGHVERLPLYVRAGTLDAMMVRPLPVLAQLATSDFALRRLGRTVQALGVLVVALLVVDIDWTPARLLLLVMTPLCGAVIFGSVFVATAAATFWLVEGGEFANAFTDGGNYLASWPLSVFHTVVRTFFTFVLPGAFVAYLPTLALLGRSDPTGLPGWASWCAPLAAVAAATAAGLVWRAGVRHYVGAGS